MHYSNIYRVSTYSTYMEHTIFFDLLSICNQLLFTHHLFTLFYMVFFYVTFLTCPRCSSRHPLYNALLKICSPFLFYCYPSVLLYMLPLFKNPQLPVCSV